MNQSFLVGNRTTTLGHITGEVLSYNKHSESHVYGSGGGHNNSHVRINTKVVTRTEIFIKDENNVEHEIKLVSEKDVALRQGQKVSMVKAEIEDDHYYWVYLWVHNTDREYFLNERQYVYSNKKLWHYILLGFAVLFFKYYFDMTGWIFPTISALVSTFIVIAIVTSKILKPIAIKELDKNIRSYSDTNLSK